VPGFSLHHLFKYRTQAGPDGVPHRVAVLRDVTAEIPSGRMCLLLGASGSGKSTLLRLLNRLDDPDGGEIRLDGAPLGDMPVVTLRRQVALVGQQPAPFSGTVAENVGYGPRLQGLPKPEIEERVREALRRVGLGEELLGREAERLSVGQQQRVCLARALALRPKALLLDEPTSALDPASARVIVETVATLQRDLGLTVVYVTHRLEEARALGGMALILVAGEVVEAGETALLLAQPQTEAGRAFVQRAPQGAEAQ
jgi:ABC-type methionine transport system ATPase subunit